MPAIVHRLTLLFCLLTAIASAREDRHTPIKIMSFNIRYGLAKDGENSWPQRQALVLETIQTSSPDLLGLQEALDFQVEFLKGMLPDYGFYGVARDDGKEKGEFAPVMYKKSRFEAIDTGHFWLSETPDIIGSKHWDAALPRIATWIHLRDKGSGNSELIFGNTHFDHKGQEARYQSARLIRERINAIKSPVGLIITGDFNTHEKLEPYAVLVNATGVEGTPLVDTYRVIYPIQGSSEGTFGAFTGKKDGNRIDWILHSEIFTTLSASINYFQEAGRYPSDHFPVEATVRFK